jgi:hypothetical protein
LHQFAKVAQNQQNCLRNKLRAQQTPRNLAAGDQMKDLARLYGPTDTRVGTRAVLKQLTKRPSFDLKHAGIKLHKKEVASFAADTLRQVWVAAQGAELTGLSALVERAYIEAYSSLLSKNSTEQN